MLDATYRLLSERDAIAPEDVSAEMGEGTDPDHVNRALAQLYREGYVTGFGIENVPWPLSIQPAEKGLRAAAGWPSESSSAHETQIGALLRLLDERIADEATPEEERGRLRRVREAIGSASTKVFGEVLGRFLAEMAKGNAG